MIKKKNDKRLVFAIVLLFCFTISIPSQNAQLYGELDNSNNSTIVENNLDYTHFVFGEEGTGTWCYWCQFVIPILHNIWLAGNRDWHYVALVEDQNSYARSRALELGLTGYPTMFYDAGYQTIVGGGATQAAHEAAIDACGARAVPDLDLDLSVVWLGNSQLGVSLDVTNNEGSTYNGHVHVYVTEPDSRWVHTSTGIQYHYAMIGNFAINQGVTVGAGQTQTVSATWTSPYSDITIGNINVKAAIFPSASGYADQCTAADPDPPNSNPPTTPSQPAGQDNGFIGIEYTYSTSSTEPNGDLIKYGWDWDGNGDVDEWTDYKPSGQTVNTDHTWNSLGTYNVQVKAEDIFGDQSSFSQVKQVTIGIGDPPNTPSNPSGETNGVHGTSYTYSTSTTDPNNGDQIYYWFDWGDGSNSGWKGPFDSGGTGSASKKWNNPGSFDIKVKAKDLADSESEWSDVTTISMKNTPPEAPGRPNGALDGIIGKEYTYSTSGSSDPEGDNLEYLFDWGDGSDSGWSTSRYAKHTWIEVGSYEIKVRARDWDVSDWSPILLTTMQGGSFSVTAGGPYYGVVGEEIQFNGEASGGTEPYSWVWSFGDDNTSEDENPTYAYASEGEYTVSVGVTDDIGGYGSNFSTASIILTHPPNKPSITGPSSGKPEESYDYTFNAIDPDGDDVFLWIEWYEGDTNSQWEGPFDSGEQVSLNHTWSADGNYSIRAKAKDIHEYEATGRSLK